jgi:hypothetical protein
VVTVRDLYPHLNDEKLKEADENLDRYLELTLRIYDRIGTKLLPEAKVLREIKLRYQKRRQPKP